VDSPTAAAQSSLFLRFFAPTLPGRVKRIALGICAGVLGGFALGILITQLLSSAVAGQLIPVPHDVNRASLGDQRQQLRQAHAYLSAPATLSINSKSLIGALLSAPFKRPDWGWSRSAYTTAHVPMQRVFSQYAHFSPVTKNINFKANPDRLVVAIDPGHGGIDRGSLAHNGLSEKDLTLDMAKRVELFLSEIDNVDVLMTRTDDIGMSRQERVDRIQAVNADVVVSLHFNHLPQRELNIVESFYADRHNIRESLEAQKRNPTNQDLDIADASRHLAGVMHKKVFNEVASVNDDVIDAGVKRDTLFVLTRSATPGVLLELTCLSNPAEAERLATHEYRNQLAAAIADGLRDYLVEEHGDRFADLLAKLDQ